MDTTSPQDVSLGYRVIKGGAVAGLWGDGKGLLTAQGLQLGKELLPWENLGDTLTRDNRLVIAVSGTSFPEKIGKMVESGVIVLDVKRAAASLLKRGIDLPISRRRAQEVARANKAGRKGKLTAALPHYDAALQVWPEHPGLLFDKALAHALANDVEGTRQWCGQSLNSCSNYLPAARLLEAVDSMGSGPQAAGTGRVQIQSANPMTTHI